MHNLNIPTVIYKHAEQSKTRLRTAVLIVVARKGNHLRVPRARHSGAKQQHAIRTSLSTTEHNMRKRGQMRTTIAVVGAVQKNDQPVPVPASADEACPGTRALVTAAPRPEPAMAAGEW